MTFFHDISISNQWAVEIDAPHFRNPASIFQAEAGWWLLRKAQFFRVGSLRP
jgi:hypothetical protein